MSAKKRLPGDPHDNPTRKVESMSSLAADLLLREHGLDDDSGRRLRSSPPSGRDAYSEPWRPSTSPPPPPHGLATEPPPRRGLRIALLVVGAVLLVVLSVTVTLLVAR